MACTASESAPPKKIAEETSLLLIGIEGCNARFNDVLFRPARSRPEVCDAYEDDSDGTKTLVYFGGDIQNFYHMMEQNDPEVPYHDWSLETTAERLGTDFPDHHIVVIRPSRIANKDISCYDNFVKGNLVGAPKHVYQYDALVHLERLLITISIKIRSTPEALYQCLRKPGVDREEEHLTPEQRDTNRRISPLSSEERGQLLWWQDNISLHKNPLTLVAFSKGCVVLNQLLFEFHYARHLEPTKQDSRFIDRIKEMYWLDGAHSQRTNTWITARAPLQTLAKLKIKVHVHVSGYQVKDPRRPWIGRDEKEFVATLKSLHADVFRYFHSSENPDLYAHFAVINKFMQAELLHNVPPPLDTTFIFLATANRTAPSEYVLGVDTLSRIVSTEEEDKRTPIFRKTHPLTRVKQLEPGLFITCNANLYRITDGYVLVLSVFQVTGPPKKACHASVTFGVPGEPATYLAAAPSSEGSHGTREVPPRPVNINFRHTLAMKHSFVANIGNEDHSSQQAQAKLVLRESHQLPRLEPSRYPRISYRFDLREELADKTVIYWCTLSVFQVAAREPAARTYTKIDPPHAARRTPIPADIPSDGTTYSQNAVLTFTVLSPTPSIDPLQNDDGNTSTYFYENGHMAYFQSYLCNQSPCHSPRACSVRDVGRTDVNAISNTDTVSAGPGTSNTGATSNPHSFTRHDS